MILDSKPVQRLRSVHQLALSYLVYPGATHRRFSHALGTMELATRVYDVVTDPRNIHPKIRETLAEIDLDRNRLYWRSVLRMAALCHDLGHLPFSHAAEKQLLPPGWNHEKLTVAFVNDPEMVALWNKMSFPLRPSDVAKIAVGAKELPEQNFTIWETLLSEIIVGNAFGVDRMDYLLRDSHYAGVAYGKFDHYRLIDTLRILPRGSADDINASEEPTLGVEEGGIHSAEALLLARYFMFTQVCFHPVRRAYDIHLVDFLKRWLPEGHFPTDVNELLRITDDEVLAAIRRISDEPGHPAYEAAQIINKRRHFNLVCKIGIEELSIRLDAGEVLLHALQEQFGESKARRDSYTEKRAVFDFPVDKGGGQIGSSSSESEVLQRISVAGFDYLFIHPDHRDDASRWLSRNKKKILEQTPVKEEE